VCIRYVRDHDDAKDVLSDAFIKIFQNIGGLKYMMEGGLEAWLRKIVINQSLIFLRKRKLLKLHDLGEHHHLVSPDLADIDLDAKDLYASILELPVGYRTIFNLFAVEGYSHKEIAEKLGITESASRSQMTRARSNLQAIVKKLTNKNRGNTGL